MEEKKDEVENKKLMKRKGGVSELVKMMEESEKGGGQEVRIWKRKRKRGDL